MIHQQSSLFSFLPSGRERSGKASSLIMSLSLFPFLSSSDHEKASSSTMLSSLFHGFWSPQEIGKGFIINFYLFKYLIHLHCLNIVYYFNVETRIRIYCYSLFVTLSQSIWSPYFCVILTPIILLYLLNFLHFLSHCIQGLSLSFFTSMLIIITTRISNYELLFSSHIRNQYGGLLFFVSHLISI